jgi:hypothetical protein
MTASRIRMGVAALLMLCWATSLVLPTVAISLRGEFNPGAYVLMIGWMGPLVGLFGWFANFLLPGVLVLTLFATPAPRPMLAVFAAVLLALCLNSLSWDHIPSGDSTSKISAFGPGYYLWLSTMAAAAVWLAILALAPRQREEAR